MTTEAEFNKIVEWHLGALRETTPDKQRFFFFMRHAKGIDVFVYDLEVNAASPLYVANLATKDLGDLVTTVPGDVSSLTINNMHEISQRIREDEERAERQSAAVTP